ncbi:hypothetical protein AVEN_67989-1, partial [Araneus ventricosus]
ASLTSRKVYLNPSTVVCFLTSLTPLPPSNKTNTAIAYQQQERIYDWRQHFDCHSSVQGRILTKPPQHHETVTTIKTKSAPGTVATSRRHCKLLPRIPGDRPHHPIADDFHHLLPLLRATTGRPGSNDKEKTNCYKPALPRHHPLLLPLRILPLPHCSSASFHLWKRDVAE